MNEETAVEGELILESRRLLHLVVAVDAGTLAEAAEVLFLTQQAVSASIRQLERDVGVQVFDRSRRRLSLTPAGQVLYDGAKSLLAANSALVKAVRDHASRDVKPFVIGHSPAISSDEVYRLMDPAIEAFPQQPLTARQLYPSQFAEMLFSGELDLVVRRGVATPEALASAVIAYHELRIAVVRDHPLASLDKIHKRQLAQTPVVVWAPERHSFYTDFLVAFCRRGGFEPELIVNPIQGTPPYTAVQRYPQACAFVTDLPGDLDGGAVRVIEFVDPPLAPVQALWLPHTHSDVRSMIVDTPSADRANRTWASTTQAVESE